MSSAPNPCSVEKFDEPGKVSSKVEECSTGYTCSTGMDPTTFYRDRANHLRQLAELTWQEGLETMLRDLAEQCDKMAATVESGAELGSQSTTNQGSRFDLTATPATASIASSSTPKPASASTQRAGKRL